MKTFLDEMTKEEIDALEEACTKMAMNMGAPKDMFHPDYGWILRDGELTQAGADFLEKEYKDKGTK